VYPAEVERVLVELPGISDLAVIGVPDEREGEVPKAIVVAAEGTPSTRPRCSPTAAAPGLSQVPALRRRR